MTQSVRAAGDGNTAYNNVAINCHRSQSGPGAGARPRAGTDGRADYRRQQCCRQRRAFRPTAVASRWPFRPAGNQGTALQQVAQGGLLQNTRLLGSANVVNNMTQLNVVLNNNGMSAGALDCNLTQLRALRTIGY